MLSTILSVSACNGKQRLELDHGAHSSLVGAGSWQTMWPELPPPRAALTQLSQGQAENNCITVD